MNALRSPDEAVAWLRSIWMDDRPAPLRLHDLETERQGELGAPRMTGAFLGYLLAQADDEVMTPVTVRCPQTVHRGDDWLGAASCPSCNGVGTYEVERARYRYPLWRALLALERKPAIRPGQPSPFEIVHQVAATPSLRMAHRLGNVETPLSWDAYEALAVMAIRDLYARYAAGPPPRRVDRISESQSIAEAVA